MSILRCHAIVALPLHPTSSTKIQAVWCSISSIRQQRSYLGPV